MWGHLWLSGTGGVAVGWVLRFGASGGIGGLPGLVYMGRFLGVDMRIWGLNSEASLYMGVILLGCSMLPLTA